jgi:hypothetical protein
MQLKNPCESLRFRAEKYEDMLTDSGAIEIFQRSDNGRSVYGEAGKCQGGEVPY